MYKRFIKWFNDNIASVLTVFSICAGLLGVIFHISGSSSALITTLLIIVAVDLIAIIHGYLKKGSFINKRIAMNMDTLLRYAAGGYNDKVMLHTNHTWDASVIEALKKATNDIFFSSVTLYTICSTRSFIENLNSEINLRLLSTDTKDNAMFVQFCRMRDLDFHKAFDRYESYRNMVNSSLHDIFKTKQNIEERLAVRIVPCTFFAVDIIKPNENSYIKVDYFILDEHTDDWTVAVVAEYGDPLFDVMRRQIEKIWREAKIVDRNAAGGNSQ